MQPQRPYVLSIAGLDPSGGAGLLADIKTFEQNQVYGFGVCSALTVQTDDQVLKVQWLDSAEIINQMEPLLKKFKVAACKIGIVQNWEVLLKILKYLKSALPGLPIVLDPVLKASAGFTFQFNLENWQTILPFLKVITPNYEEWQQLEANQNSEESAARLSFNCAILLKGGHHPQKPGTDFLFQNGECTAIPPTLTSIFPKHGSGCVLSSAIAANLAKGYALTEACQQAKNYTEQFLSSSPNLLGHHTS
ncbi:MAG: hydroxymethylpyrimidine/phosphomethylpyrimidine kinase [Bacteroidota bacterium]|nr:hydroxymethylpyrimidine/phosphomethylpyrimidine kinase [Bacteroidota bacterium]